MNARPDPRACAILAGVMIGLVPAAAFAENRMKVADGALRYRNTGFDLWGLELNAEHKLRADAEAFRDAFQPWVTHGINTLGFSLQPWSADRPFFNPEGEPTSPQVVRRFRTVTGLLYGYRFCTIVSLFSADRSQWLASPEAYENAARAAAAALPEKHCVVFIAGDLFGGRRWGAGAPSGLDDPARAVALCRILKESNPEAVVGIPAVTVLPAESGTDGGAWFYVAQSAEALAAFVGGRDRSVAAAQRAGVATVTSDRFLRRRDAGLDFEHALEEYGKRVARARLSLHAPVKQAGDASGYLTPDEKAAGWVSLFDGKTLDGWTVLLADWAGWSVRDGAITSPQIHAPFLRTRKAFGAFVLRFEYNISKGGNSGVFIWAPLDGRSSRFGMEVQLLGHRRDVSNHDTTGAIYAVRAPREDASYAPGQWNRVEIRGQGSHVVVKINDRIVQDFDADEDPTLQKRLRRGHIGFQDHGHAVQFRHVRILELTRK